MSLSDSRYELAAISAKINLAFSQSHHLKKPQTTVTIIINKKKESAEERADKHCFFLPLLWHSLERSGCISSAKHDISMTMIRKNWRQGWGRGFPGSCSSDPNPISCSRQAGAWGLILKSVSSSQALKSVWPKHQLPASIYLLLPVF